MFFVDELDRNDGFRLVVGYCFAYAENVCQFTYCVAGCLTDDAYAPCPIVLLTSRKGRLDGNGAT